MASLGLTVARIEKQVIVTAPGIQGPPGIQGDTGPTGSTGPTGPQGNSISIKGTLAAGAWSAPASPTIGDIWIAGGVITGAVTAILGDGLEWTGLAWQNVGQLRGPIGETGPVAVTDHEKLKWWAEARAYTLTSATRDSDDVINVATVSWPDGSSGTYTRVTKNATFLVVDAYTVTHVGFGLTVTQSAVTRNAAGSITAQPALTVA